MIAFDEINHTLVKRGDLSPGDLARRAIRSIQKRLANPEIADDVRENNRRELRRWRGILMRGNLGN